MRSLLRVALLAGAALAVTMSGLAGPAAATPPTPSSAARPAQPAVIQGPAGTIRSERVTATPGAASAALAGCAGVPITRGAYTGAVCDGTIIIDVEFTGGIKQTFVIGTTTSDNIYTIWQRSPGDTQWTGWQHLPGGGTANAGIWAWWDSSNRLVVNVLGTDWNNYCNHRSPPWSGWYSC